MIRSTLLALVAVALVGCQSDSGPDSRSQSPAEPESAPMVDMHSSRIALDWAGTYAGLLACTDCPGVHVQLTLGTDGDFAMTTRRLVRGESPSSFMGRFDWETGDRVIRLLTDEGLQRFAVGEGRLLRMEAGQGQPTWGNAEALLFQIADDANGAGQGLGEILEDHRWILVSAADASGEHLGSFFPEPARPFSFRFSSGRLQVEGGCNGLRGGYALEGKETLVVSGGMSTMMACEDGLMAADAALADLLANPVEILLIKGVDPRLVLLSSNGNALVLKGELTPEARYGEATVLFLEVSAERVSCEDSARNDGECLQVRDVSFDEQGLQVGEPEDWRPFSAEIKGYDHEAGTRNILRVRQYANPPGSIYYLDLVVVSEVMP